MSKRRTKKNPNGLAAAAAVAVGLLGVGAIAWSMSDKPKAKKKVGPSPAPTPTAEYGIFINATCTDFEIKEPPSGTDTSTLPQAVTMNAIVEAAVARGGDLDPFPLAADWLRKVAPASCTWPPTATSTARISNMYIYMASLFALMAINRGATVLGVKTMADVNALAEAVDEAILKRAGEMGLAEYDADVIPDLVPAGPPDLGQTAVIPVITAAYPNRFAVTDKAAATTLAGENLTPDLKFRLFDHDQGIAADGQSTWNGGAPQILFMPKLGEFTVQLKGSDDTEWSDSEVVVSMTASQQGFSPKN